MQESDIPAVQRLDAASSGISIEKARHPKILGAAINQNTSGCFIAESGDAAAGFVFAHRWGAVGWIGPLAVAPESQGKGIGRALLRHAREFLTGKAEVIGTQFAFDSYNGAGVCLAEGFQPVEPQFVLSQQLSQVPADRIGVEPSKFPLTDVIAIRELAGQVERDGLGRMVSSLADPMVAGAVVMETVPRRANVTAIAAVVTAGFVPRTLGCEYLDCILQRSADAARAAKSASVFVALNGCYQRELVRLCGQGWRIRGASVRLVHGKSLGRYKQMLALPQVDLCNWAL